MAGADAELGVIAGIEIRVIYKNLKTLEDGVGGAGSGEAETGEYADVKDAVCNLYIEGVFSGDVGAGDLALTNRECQLVNIFSDNCAFDGELVVAAIAGVNQVEVDRVGTIGNGNLHVPVGRFAGIVPANVLEALQVLSVVPIKTQGGDAGRYYGSGPVDDRLSTTYIVGTDAERIDVDSLVGEPDVTIGVGNLASAAIDSDREIKCSLCHDLAGCRKTEQERQ